MQQWADNGWLEPHVTSPAEIANLLAIDEVGDDQIVNVNKFQYHENYGGGNPTNMMRAMEYMGLLDIARRMLHDAENIKQVGQEFHSHDSGHLTIATTHTQARYALPLVVKQFIERYPKVKLGLHQGSPTQIAEQVLNGEADIGIATESLSLYSDLVALPGYEWHHCVITPPRHPLLKEKTLTLEAIARYPIITYDFAFTGRGKINEAFQVAGITPNIALTAIDADVIKTYVELGLGVGILAHMSFIPERDKHLRMLEAGHLFKPSTTRIAIRKNEYLRGYTYDFIELFAPHLTREAVTRAMHLAKMPEQE